MSKLKSFISKRRKKEDLDIPTIFNGFYQFNHENIINKSKTSEIPFIGCDISDTLHLVEEQSPSGFSFILTGKLGCEIYSAIQNRSEEKSPPLLMFADSDDITQLSKKIPSIELPSRTLDESTFSLGVKWFESNKEQIRNHIDRSLRNVSAVFVFCENDGFIFGLVSQLIQLASGKNILLIPVIHLPIQGENVVNDFSALTFIHYLMNDKIAKNTPFILVDEGLLFKANEPLKSLRKKLYYRETNILLDLLLGSLTPSEFYNVDFSNFIRIFESAKGPCKLLSFDVYEDKPDISYLLGTKAFSESFPTEINPTRGYLVIQPGPKGLTTKNYRSFRNHFANLDVIFSILKKRSNGSLIRGIFTFNDPPKLLLGRYSLLADIVVELLDEQKQSKGVFDLSVLDEIWNHDYYIVTKYVESKES